MDGERADVTAREFQRLNREAIRCDHDFAITEINLDSIRLHVDFARG